MDKTEEDYRTHYRYHYHHRSGLGALLLIFLGVIFLLNNFGILSWDIWNIVWRFWPLLLILAGLQLVMGRSRSSQIIILLVGLLFIAAVILYALASQDVSISNWLFNHLPWLPPIHSSQDLFQSYDSRPYDY